MWRKLFLIIGKFCKFLYENEVLRFFVLAVIILAIIIMAVKLMYIKVVCKKTLEDYKKFKIIRRHYILDQKFQGLKPCRWLKLRHFLLTAKEERLRKKIKKTSLQIEKVDDLLDKYSIKNIRFIEEKTSKKKDVIK